MALLALRLWLGLSMLLLHGWDKLTGFTQMAPQFPDPLGIGSHASLALSVLAEALCSVLLVLGLFTRLAALGLIINLGVAFWFVHGHALTGAHSGELAFVYLAGYVALFLAGGGRLSLDARTGRTPA
jgi:putative oxidoreductase